MSLPLVLLPGASADIEQLASWASQHSAAARTKLLAAIADKMQLIEQQPEMYAVSPLRPPLRRCVVSATISLYYRIQPQAIEVVTVVDTRRAPYAPGNE